MFLIKTACLNRSSITLNSLIIRFGQIQLNYSTDSQTPDIVGDVTSKKKCEESDWKKNIVVQPIKTNIEDLKRMFKPLKDTFYINPKYYIDRPPDDYTIEPFRTYRTGGYDIETKTRLFRRMGGGLPVTWYWVDYKRVGPKSGPPLVERVIDIFKSRDRTAFIALVAHANVKRYILATQNMKVGDLISTYGVLPKDPITGKEGDAHPLGALQIGTIVHNIERVLGEGGYYCKAAGASAEITRKVDDRVIIKLPSGIEVSLNKKCMATVGQVSHASHKDEKLTHAVDIRDLGYRPRSGLWQRKTGRFGRKCKPPKPPKIAGENVKVEKAKRIPYTYANWSLTE